MIAKLLETFLEPEPSPKQILVVDDDPTFAAILRKVGKRKGMKITEYLSVDDLVGVDVSQFDAVILDYFIDAQTRGTDLLPLFKQKPIVMVSRTSRALAAEPLPKDVLSFVHKKYGAEEILNKVASLIQ